MGLRDWFKSTPTTEAGDDHADIDAEKEAAEQEAFAALQASKTTEALSLFDEEEPEPVKEKTVDAPYDAGDGDLADLLSEVEESFTHTDEVDIADVAELDDPYANAVIEGDLPEAVVFDDEEKTGSV